MHITGHFASPNGNRDLDIGMNPAWRASVMDLIPWEPFEGRSKAAEDATSKRMTTVKMQALRDLAPDSGAYFNEVGFEVLLSVMLIPSATHTSRTGAGPSSAQITAGCWW
jgi:hypothetical protein